MFIWLLCFILMCLVGIIIVFYVHLKIRRTLTHDTLKWLRKLHHDTLILQQRLKEALERYPSSV